ncbi:MAG TPA: hypothetical protein VFQ80_17985, partial [Thermomicrobiales bacterium]|nr:hypothetical protein [Thermomicrobiales bacterium]
MTALRRPALVYIAVVVAAAVAAGAVAVATLAHASSPRLGLTLGLAVAAALAWRFPLHLGFRTKFTVDTAVAAAAILLLSPAVAALAAGAGAAVGHLIRPRGRDAIEASFNAAQATLVALAGAVLLASVGWNPAHPDFDRFWPLLALPLIALAMHLLNVASVAVVTALQEELAPAATVRTALGDNAAIEWPAQFVLFALGVLAAIVFHAEAWALALLAAPIAATWLALRHQLREREAAEQARQTSETNLAEAQRLARLGNWEWDPASGHLHASAEAWRILGL